MQIHRLIPLALSLSAMSIHAEPALTIYNQDFAVVRELVPLQLRKGITEARYTDMVSQLEPDSVILRDPSGKSPFQILEQNYRNDPVTQELLLSLNEGKTIEFFIKEPNKPDAMARGKIIRSGYKTNTQPVIEINGQLQFRLPGQPVFPSLGDDTVLNPTLTWKIESSKDARIDAELAYITGGLSWEADYNLIAPEKGSLADLIGWVTVKNESGKTFHDARVKLMAGDVHKLPSPKEAPTGYGMRAARAEMAAVVTEKAFDEFHLYTLSASTTLRDRETKQVEFVRATGVTMDRIYVYDGAQLDGWRVGITYGADPGYGEASHRKVAVYREFQNSTANHLGQPLPKGRVRFYTQDGVDQSLQFVGENFLDHTPRDERVRLYTGDSFDPVGERKRIEFTVDEANHTASESFEIKLRNRKQEPVEIRVVEHLFRWVNWEIKDKSQEFMKTDAQTIEFRVALKPDQQKSVTYSVKYSW